MRRPPPPPQARGDVRVHGRVELLRGRGARDAAHTGQPAGQRAHLPRAARRARKSHLNTFF